MRTKSILPTLLGFLLSASLPTSFFAQNPCDTVPVVAQATATDLTCDNPVATLTGALDPSALSYHWSGPGAFSSNNRIAQNFVTGTYLLVVTGAYGCTAQTTVTVLDQCATYPLVPPACDPPYQNVVPADDCWDACVMPLLPQNVIYNTTGYSPGLPGGWCGTIENDQWFAFVAGATGGSITATPMNCANGDGIQMGLYSECPANMPLACNGGGMGYGDVPISISVNGLNIGQVYYLIVDGYAGDQCDFVFQTTPGICDAPNQGSQPDLEVQGDSLVCPNAVAEYQVLNLNNSIASATLWTAPLGSLINGLDNPLLIYKPDGAQVWVQFGTQSGFVCMRQIYYFYPPSPPICFPVNNEPIPPTIFPTVTVCDENVPYVLPWGDEAYFTGNYQVTLSSVLGCDSIVKQHVIVKPPIIKNLGAIVLCAGDCFEIGGESYCETGAYSAILESYLGCDSTVNFQLLFANPVAEILGGGTLTCSQTTVALTSAPNPGLKIWKNAAGQTVGAGNFLNVTQPGLYILNVSQTINGTTCVKADSILIEQDVTPVQATAQGGTLSCSSPLVTLIGSASDPQATLSWSGPNGFTAAGPQAVVSAAGNYYLIAVSPNGCTDTDLAAVTADQGLPIVDATGGVLTCFQTSVLLQYSASDPQATFTLFDPNGQAFPDPNVTAPGIYTVVATTPNGCSAAAFASVTADQDPPILVASGGTLTCTTLEITLQSDASLPLISLEWTGPNGFVSMDPIPTVDQPGVYTLTGVAGNGCQGSATALVVADQDAPPLSLSADEVNCDPGNDAHVYAAPVLPNLTYTWSGPDNFTAYEAAPAIIAPGNYAVTVVNPNSGCSTVASIEVSGSLDLPDLDVMQVAPACGDTLLYLNANSSTPGVHFHWTGPDAFTSDEEDPVVLTPGWYKVTAATNNACEASINILVVDAPAIPQLSISGGAISCLLTPVPLLVTCDLPVDSYEWTGPGNFSSQEASPMVSNPGTYYLTVTAANGCTTEASVLVPIDVVPPAVDATGGVLTCAQPVTTITATSTTPGAILSWQGGNFPTGQATVQVDEAGVYEVVATAPNGCTSTASVFIPQDISTPVVSATGGVLTCAQPVTTITATSSTPGAILSWQGSNFPTGQATVQVDEAGVYEVVATAPNGCTSIASVNVADSCLTGVHAADDRLQPGLRLYPNTSTGVVFVEAVNTNGLDALLVYAADGRLIWSSDFDSPQAVQRLDLTHQPTGTYLVTARIGARWFVEKLVLMR